MASHGCIDSWFGLSFWILMHQRKHISTSLRGNVGLRTEAVFSNTIMSSPQLLVLCFMHLLIDWLMIMEIRSVRYVKIRP